MKSVVSTSKFLPNLFMLNCGNSLIILQTNGYERHDAMHKKEKSTQQTQDYFDKGVCIKYWSISIK